VGTQNNPGKFDCIAKAEGDEPLFTLLGRDPLGAEHVMLWVTLRNKDDHGARRLLEKMIDRANAVPYRRGQSDKILSAIEIAGHMTVFRAARRERRQ